jgi:hypothetical protein
VLNWLHSEWAPPLDQTTDFLATSRQRWFLLDGQANASATEIALNIHTAGDLRTLIEPLGISASQGVATLTFVDSETAFLRYQLPGICLSACSSRVPELHRGVIPLRRLLAAEAEQSRPNRPSSAIYLEVSGARQAMMTVMSKSAIFATWFGQTTTDAMTPSNSSAWFTLHADLPPDDETPVTAKIYRTVGGRRDTNLASVAEMIGTATLSFEQCQRLTVRYQFLSNELAQPLSGRSGELAFRGIAGCF